jgi:choline dehydrogenase-like flavoprotein
MFVLRQDSPDSRPAYDLIIAGTGFASSFFLLEYLDRAPATARVLVIERGWRESRGWQLTERKVSRIDHGSTFRREGFAGKDWAFTVGFGGGSNCWWACTPRFMPRDFTLRTSYGVGDDWPLGYGDLEPFYERAEQVMAVAGSQDFAPYPRRQPLPQPPHRLSDPDRRMAARDPRLVVPQPTARARVATGRRGVCCANGTCGLCPVDAKFTIENGLAEVYADSRVTLRLGAEVKAVEVTASRAVAVMCDGEAGPDVARGDLIVLGAGAMANAAILLRSNLPHPMLGRRLFEQVSVHADIDLDGVDNFQGSSVISGNWYGLYDGPHRRSHAACLIESWNRPDRLRWEQGRERQLLQLKLIFEDLPDERNRVILGADDMPVLEFLDYSDYAYRGIAEAQRRLDQLLAPLPVERVFFDATPSATEGHMLGTVVMGNDPAASVVDRWMVHHEVRNLVVLGGSAFPTGGPSNPTLTISALALWSANHLFS